MFSTILQRRNHIVENSFNPWIRDFVQIFLNFLLREVFVHPAQEVGYSIVFTLLIFEGKVVAGELSYPPLPSGIQVRR